MKKNLLAIVIPYYKISYFQELLSSLAKQTNLNFNLYIGDDNSPNSPIAIIDKFREKLNIKYKKFNKNLGGINLVGQWDRCIDMIKDEEWIWLLPDDDIPSLNVVEEFYKALKFKEHYKIKVFRFPLSIINQESKVLKTLNYNNPLVESNLDFYQRVVRGKASASLGDNIFHRQSLESSGGFVSFPKAWGSDHATILNVASGGKIYFLSNAILYFRMSGENISSDRSDGLIKLGARVEFAKWLKNNEYIFPKKLDSDFYKFFYWKGEYFILSEWEFDLALFTKLYQLRKVCINNNIIPIVSIFFKKIKMELLG
ncbi:MAG: glycosyltransferase [Sulfurovum sp.]